jgi:hypothetical protein
MPDVPAVFADARGEFGFEAIPSGAHALRATQLRLGLLFENCPSQGAQAPERECGRVYVWPGQTASADLRLAPPSRNRRVVRVLARGTVTDHEDFVANEVGDRDFEVDLEVSPLERSAERLVETCVGGEIRVEILVRATLLDDNLSVRAEILGELFEGTDCETQDLEDSDGQQADIFEGEGTQLFLNLRNSGPGGGDSAEYLFDVFNEQAP